MSMPSIPGYIGPSTGRAQTLADLWQRPQGEFPPELWPTDVLAEMCPDPTGWVTVEQHYFSEERHGGAGCVLVRPEDEERALEDTTWIGRDLGEVGVWSSGQFDNGLHLTERDCEVEFLVHARRPSGATMPVVEVSHTFLWFWDAYPAKAGWRYLNRAGREQELIRWELTEDSWTVEVRALELRHFLATAHRTAVLQRDYVTKIEAPEFERVDDAFSSQWAHVSFYALHNTSMPSRPAYSGLMGQYLLTGLRTSRVPRWEERTEDRAFPEFIYDISAQTGQPLRHTCDPNQLGTYFDKDGTRLHYLTPIYFKREVLQPYAAEPTKYRVSHSRLSCLDLWGLDISFNSLGLVEVYLGDLGTHLPSDEWAHWLSYNVTPEGNMDEGRFRRDFLGQWASSRDIVGDLRRAREAAAAASTEMLGTPIWRPLTAPTHHEFESLIGPLNDDPVALAPSLLLLAKALVDAIDPAPMKTFLGNSQKDERSISLLRRLVEKLGGEPEDVAMLHKLQSFRSRGGVAHLASSASEGAARDLGIDGMRSTEAFESIVVRLTATLHRITELMSATSADPGGTAKHPSAK